MTNETKTWAELSQNERRNSTLKSQLNEWAPPVGSGPATPLTDAVWLTDDELEEIQNKSWCVENCNYNLGQFLTRKYGPPSSIADLERQLAFRTEQVRTLEVANDEIERQLAELQRDLLTREQGGEWVSRCDHEDALAEARKDTERLDWLMGDVVNTPVSPWMSISRTDIDTAMKGDSQ